MNKVYNQITELKLTVFVGILLFLLASYSFVTKQYFASDSFSFLLGMIESTHFVDFYQDRQYANYFTQFIPFFILKYGNPSFETLQLAWGFNFIYVPLLVLFLSQYNFSKSFKGLNLYLICITLFYIPISTRWISESVVCLILSIYIFSVYFKVNKSLLEMIAIAVSAFILIKSYSTTAFVNVFLIYLAYNSKNDHWIFRSLMIVLLGAGFVVGWKSILYPMFPMTFEETSHSIKSLFFYRINLIHLTIAGHFIILLGLIKKSPKIILLALIPFVSHLLPGTWNSFLELNPFRFVLSLPVLIVFIILWHFKDSKLNNKVTALVLLSSLIFSIPSSVWIIQNWEKSLQAYEEFYASKVGDINIFKTRFSVYPNPSPFGWEVINYQLLFPKNTNLNLYYKGPKHENWIQEDFNVLEKKMNDLGWR